MNSSHPDYPAFALPDHISRQTVSIWSDGLRIDADLYKPLSLVDSCSVAPAIVMTHGLGGSKRTAERYAAEFANAGMVAIAFTHAGWFASDAKAYMSASAGQEGTAENEKSSVRFARQVVDPLEWMQTFRVAVDYIEGEANVDTSKIGGWGTSFGGGIALLSACRDDRIKAIAIQVPYVAGIPPAQAGYARRRAIEMARGVIPSVPDASMDSFPKAPGIPHFARMRAFAPLDDISKLKIPTLVIDAGSEDQFDIRHNGGAVSAYLEREGHVPHSYRVIPGINHYGIYFDGYAEGVSLATSWFHKHLLETEG